MEPDIATNAGKETSPQQPALNVGMALRQAREALELSVHDVAERIKFAPKQVEALEANDFEHLPQATFLRGFVRSYARMLHLEEAPLLAALPVDSDKQTGTKTQAVDVIFPTIQSLQRVNVIWLAGALGVALVLGLFALLHNGERSEKPVEVVVEPLTLPASAVVASSAAVNTEEQPQKNELAEEKLKTSASAKAAEPKKAAEAVKPPESKKPESKKIVKPDTTKQPGATHELQIAAASAPADTAKPPVPLELLKRRPLHFVFSENSWAEVIDVNGTILLSRSNPGGSEQWVGGPRHAPYNISIAHPGGVKLYYKGKEIDLSTFPPNAVAHLKVE